MDDDLRPINYRRTNVRFKYSRAQDQLKAQDYYHMPPLLNNPPFKINNNKKYQKEEERITQIERSNRILFEKMRNIRLKRGPYSQPGLQYRKKSASFRASNKTANSIHHYEDLPQVFNTENTKARPLHRQYQTIPQKPVTKRNSSIPSIKLGKNNMKLLYKQVKQIGCKTYSITAETQNGQFWLKDEEGGQQSNYMHMEMADYKKLEQFYLPNGIESLLNHIKIDHVIELKGLDEDKIVEVQNAGTVSRYQQK